MSFSMLDFPFPAILVRRVLIAALALALLAGCATPRPYEALLVPPAMLADLDALSLHNKGLGRLSARLLLIHGRNDNLIPYPESLALAQAAPQGKARVWLINRILGHVDLSLGHALSWRFVSQELPDIWRMSRALDALLSERDKRPEALEDV